MKMKNRSHRYDINRPRSRQEHKCSKYKKCLSMMLICIKLKHLKKLSNTKAKLKKSVAYKKACNTVSKQRTTNNKFTIKRVCLCCVCYADIAMKEKYIKN